MFNILFFSSGVKFNLKLDSNLVESDMAFLFQKPYVIVPLLK